MATSSNFPLSTVPSPNPAGFDVEMLEALSAVPQRFSVASAWIGHIPFARWLVRVAKPQQFVELGVHWGDSYCTICEAVRAAGLPTRAFGVDSWLGDPHAGLYGEEVYSKVRTYHDPMYGDFSKLIRSTFSDASQDFEAGTIDLLHIDGCHTYEAVREDFESWAPKMSRGGVVLMHDTQVKEDDFGVWRYWSEIEKKYPSFEFYHSSGLGVLCVGEEAPAAVRWLTDLSREDANSARRMFQVLGNHLDEIWKREHRIRELDNLLVSMEQSLSWYATAPLRRIARYSLLNRIASSVRHHLRA